MTNPQVGHNVFQLTAPFPHHVGASCPPSRAWNGMTTFFIQMRTLRYRCPQVLSPGPLLEGEGEQAGLGAQAQDSGGQAGHLSQVGASCPSGLGGSPVLDSRPSWVLTGYMGAKESKG